MAQLSPKDASYPLEQRKIPRDDVSGGPTDYLKLSGIYQEFRKAFEHITKLSLDLSVPATRQGEAPSTNGAMFCRLLTRDCEACACCVEFQRRLEIEAQSNPLTLQCHAGLFETIVPVRVGQKVVVYLRTGHVFQSKPGRRAFGQIARQWAAREMKPGLVRQAEEAWFGTRVVSPDKYDVYVRLLQVFARHCEDMLAVVNPSEVSEAPPFIRLARQFIQQHFFEQLTLAKVARVVHMSAHHFGKIFKIHTGVTFTEHVARVRVENAKGLLQGTGLRIKEIAYQSGFQSVSQFNRVFRRIVGVSPGDCRRGQAD